MNIGLFKSGAIAAILVLTSGCMHMVNKGDKFPKLYEQHPRSILILPPMNESTAADAKGYYSTTIEEPLSFTGYYVFPYQVTTDLLKLEGIYDTELLANLPLEKFKKYFGADAVLFTTIKKWDVSYIVLASNLTVSVDCELKSTETSEILWKYNGTVVIDLSGSDGGAGGIAGLIIKAVATAVQTAMADYVPYAMRANYMALSSMPYGRYHPLYNKDKDQQIIDQTPTAK